MRNFLIALAVCAAIPATVDAGNGGGGSKPTATIKVRNNAQGQTLAVIVDKPPTITLASSRAEFEAAGGRILSWKETATFKVRAGSHTIDAAFLLPTFLPGVPVSFMVSVGKHDHISYNVDGTPFAPPVFTRR